MFSNKFQLEILQLNLLQQHLSVQEAAPAPTAAAAEKEDNSNLIAKTNDWNILSLSWADKDPFRIGSTIKAGDKLCIIEAMKLFNEIESRLVVKLH